MTDNEIIKALECLTGESIPCKDCPYSANYTHFDCQRQVAKDALDLINRQKAEIERYERENNEKFDKWKLLDERTKEWYAELYEEAKVVVRAEAVKEFVEMLKEQMCQENELYKSCAKRMLPKDYQQGYEEKNDNVIRLIDNLVKEMAGDTE